MNSPKFRQQHKILDVTQSVEYNKWQDDKTYTLKNSSETFIKENVLGKDAQKNFLRLCFYES